MELKDDIARQVVAFIHGKTGFHSIICDATGTIVADSAGTRVGVVHAGSKKILGGAQEFYRVTAAEAEASNGAMKEGFSLAIHDERGRKIGSFGIAGTLAIVEPVAKVAADLVHARLADRQRDEELRQGIQDAVRQMHRAIVDGTERMARLSDTMRRFNEANGTLARAAEESSTLVRNIGSILGLIRNVAVQTRMLGLNAAVEAARAGEHGRGFAVVADGVRRLSDESSRSVDEIGEILQRFQQTFEAVVQGAHEGQRLADEQERASAEVRTLIADLKIVGDRLRDSAEKL